MLVSRAPIFEVRREIPKTETKQLTTLKRPNAIVLFHMLPQRTQRPFLSAQRQFQLPIKPMDAIQILRTEHFQQKRARLRKISKHVFQVSMQTIIFLAVSHTNLVAKTA